MPESTHTEKTDRTESQTAEKSPLFPRLPRRNFMKAGAAFGAATALAGCTGLLDDSETTAEAGEVDSHVPPGEHDDYYAFLSGGHTGDIRVYGVPSMRQIMRIPVFNIESARGYGYDNETREMLEASGGYTWGDTHHPRPSQTDNTYDGKWMFVNDKANGRMARIDLKYFETDAIIDLPNQQGTHGACALMPDTRLVFGVGELRVPIPNDGRDLDDPGAYGSTLSAMSADPFDHEWDVLVDCNLDNGDSGKDGEWFFTTSYNTEEGTDVAEMVAADTDYVIAFNIPRIEDAVDAGEFEEINGVPVVDGTEDSPLNSGDEPLVRYIDVPSNPHGVSVTPDGAYAIASGKLDPTCTIIDIAELNNVDDPNDAIVGQVNVGNGPLHTAYDGRGHAYTTLFVDSEVVKWDIEAAVEAEMGSDEPVIEKHDVHYSPGHLIAAESYTGDPQGDWLIVLNKLSKDRFLPVGPVFPENDQLFYIGDDENGMELVKDTPAYPEPHDASIVRADRLDPADIYDPDDLSLDYSEESFIERNGDEVYVEMTNRRNEFGLTDFTVQEGDEVTIRSTNVEAESDILHSVAVPHHDINIKLAPQETREATFTADEPGVYWIYCAYFCSALHLEMRSRMLVEPAD